jgi:hypothetical protein
MGLIRTINQLLISINIHILHVFSASQVGVAYSFSKLIITGNQHLHTVQLYYLLFIKGNQMWLTRAIN